MIAVRAQLRYDGPRMPDKPLWLARLPEAIAQLKESSEPLVDRGRLETLLGIGRRRAQQLLSAVASRSIGSSRIAKVSDVVEYLERIAAGENAYYDARRRKHLWDQLGRERHQWLIQPPVLVDVETTDIKQVQLRGVEGLPEGVDLKPGCIHMTFKTPEEALEKLVALALAISRSREVFDECVRM
jgi:hypothetical protein